MFIIPPFPQNAFVRLTSFLVDAFIMGFHIFSDALWNTLCICFNLFLFFSVSAFYFESPEKQMYMNASIWTKSKFMGMSIGVVMVGKGKQWTQEDLNNKMAEILQILFRCIFLQEMFSDLLH